jgi:hypothetical protein
MLFYYAFPPLKRRATTNRPAARDWIPNGIHSERAAVQLGQGRDTRLSGERQKSGNAWVTWQGDIQCNVIFPQRPAIPNRSPRSSRKRLYTMGAGEGSAPLLSRVIQFRVRGDRGADSSPRRKTVQRNDAKILARPRNGMSLLWQCFPACTHVNDRFPHNHDPAPSGAKLLSLLNPNGASLGEPGG